MRISHIENTLGSRRDGPMYVERLIGTVRREYLERTLFWTTADLETKTI
jgi:hypothetical protein